MSSIQKIINSARRLLSRRDYSTHELRAHIEKNYPDIPYDDTLLSTLHEEGFLNDTRFAHSRARHRASQGYGPRRVAYELREHGISPEDIASAIDLVDWAEAWSKRLRKHNPSSPQAITHLAIRYGFPPNIHPTS